MGWVPKGAKLHVTYFENWVDHQDSRYFTAEVEFGDENNLKVGSTRLSVKTEPGESLVLVVQGPSSSESEKPVLEATHDGTWTDGRFEGVNKGLKRITLSGWLEVKLGDGTFSAPPHEDGVLYAPSPW